MEDVKKNIHEKRVRQKIESVVERGLDSDSILIPNTLRSSSYTQSVCKKVQHNYGTIPEREDGDKDDEDEDDSELLETQSEDIVTQIKELIFFLPGVRRIHTKERYKRNAFKCCTSHIPFFRPFLEIVFHLKVKYINHAQCRGTQIETLCSCS